MRPRPLCIPILLFSLLPPLAALAGSTFGKTILSHGIIFRAVNDRGQAAALIAEPGPRGVERMTGYVWNHEAWQRLRGPAESSVALPQAISRNGHVAGSGGARGFLVSPTTVAGRAVWYLDANGDGKNDLWTDIGTQGVNVALAVNDAGEVAGTQMAPSVRAYRWNAREGLRLLEFPEATITAAVAINERGDVLGNARRADGKVRGVRWSETSGAQDLGDLGGGVSVARAMNDSGHVVGWSLDAQGRRKGFFWNPSEGMRDVGDLGGDSAEALAVNNSGEVAGVALLPDGGERAFVWTPTTGLQDLGGACSGQSRALSVADNGLVVGLCRADSGTWQTVAWMSDGVMIALSGRGSRAQSAPLPSNSGTYIAGAAWGQDALAATAVLWTFEP